MDEDMAFVEAEPPVFEFGVREAMGFEINDTFVDELIALDLGDIDRRQARTALIVGDRSATQVVVADMLVDLGVKLKWCEEDASPWNSESALNAFVVPAAMIGAITA